MASPAMATWGSSGGWSSGGCKKHCGPTTTTSSGGTTTGSSSSGNEVPEPGMLAMAGAGLIAVAVLRRRKARNKS
ncbi:MAG: PEP-CTERM sorting domain-containing protein [Rhodocyclaceae bacterium]|nr:MAG: PEP-CTERM sorting domain-containing protein [Rhodocyclaceae bacterium]